MSVIIGLRNLEASSHQPQCLAVAFRFGHTEVAIQLLLGVTAFLLANHHHRPPFEERKAADNRFIVAERAVAVQFLKSGKQAFNVIEGMGPLGMAGENDALVAGVVDLRAGLPSVRYDGNVFLQHRVRVGITTADGSSAG